MNIPSFDILPKLFTFLGLALIFYTFNLGYEEQKQVVSQYEKLTAYHNEDVVNVEERNKYAKLVDDLTNDYIKSSKELINKYKSGQISIEQFKLSEKIDSDTFQPEINKYKDKVERLDAEVNAVQKKVKTENEIFKQRSDNASETFKVVALYSLIGFCMFFYGTYAWEKKDKNDGFEKLRENLEKPTFSENCQSCGKYFNSLVIPAKDGDKVNYHFCSDCFANGSFKEPDLTLEEMQERTKKYLLKHKKSWLKRRRVFVCIAGLDRWKMHKYY